MTQMTVSPGLRYLIAAQAGLFDGEWVYTPWFVLGCDSP
jgi:hypothetical protein